MSGRNKSRSSHGDAQLPTFQTIEDIFQIFIQDDTGLPQEFPAKVARNMRSLRNAHPQAAYHLLKGDDIPGFLAAHFASDVLDAYQSLVPYAYKCDLARLCLLFVKGGLYVDLGIRLIRPLQPPLQSGLVAFRDLMVSSKNSWAVLSGLLFVTPGRAELRTAIDLIVQNCKDRYYGATPLDPTGPSLFGRALAICNTASDHWLGDTQMRVPWFAKNHIVFVTPYGQSIAVNTKQEGGNLGELGLTGTNNYNEFWHARRVYGERG